MPAHDVAIYAPHAACLYEREPGVTGGAERQTALLAAELASRGTRTAHIVLPLEAPREMSQPALSLVQRRPFATDHRYVGRAVELARIWSALNEADAATYVFRSGLAALGVTALFCRTRRRRLIFSSANNADFTFDFYRGRRRELEAYKFGVRRSDAVVVQSGEQVALARKTFPNVERIIEIPSFAELAAPSPGHPEAFLWTGRLDEYKQPLRFLRLAEAVPEARFWMIPKFLHEDPLLAREVRERAAGLPNLELLESRPHTEAMGLIERSVAIVNTGSAEGMPNLFLEAWARGVPVASFEFDPDGRIDRLGLGVAADGSWERFRSGVQELWQAREERAEIAARVRSYVTSLHDPDAVTQRWAELIEELTVHQPANRPA